MPVDQAERKRGKSPQIIIKSLLDRSEDGALDTAALKQLLYVPHWHTRELISITNYQHRLYREEQLESRGHHPYASPFQRKQYLSNMLDKYLYIDEVQEWLVYQAVSYEKAIEDFMSSQSYPRFTILSLNSSIPALDEFRNMITKLIR